MNIKIRRQINKKIIITLLFSLIIPPNVYMRPSGVRAAEWKYTGHGSIHFLKHVHCNNFKSNLQTSEKTWSPLYPPEITTDVIPDFSSVYCTDPWQRLGSGTVLSSLSPYVFNIIHLFVSKSKAGIS